MGCGGKMNDCLNCKRSKCILDIDDEKEELKKTQNKPQEKVGKIDRSEYMRKKYLERKEKSLKDKICKYCGKECRGEMIRIDGKNYCGINCVLCYLYDKNESKMQIVVV